MEVNVLVGGLRGAPFSNAVPAPLLSGTVLLFCKGSRLSERRDERLFVDSTVLSWHLKLWKGAVSIGNSTAYVKISWEADHKQGKGHPRPQGFQR